MLNSGASVIGNLIGGFLFDKISGYRSILSGIVLTLIALIFMIFFHDWSTYVILLTMIGLGQGIVFPAMYAMSGAIWPEGERKAFNAIYVAQNVGVAVGSALGGVVASISFEFIFSANALLYLLFFIIGFIGFDKLGSKGSPNIYFAAISSYS